MGKSRQSANIVSDNNIFVDIVNDRVGIGSTLPTADLDVVGIVSATSFSGDGSNLSNLPSPSVVYIKCPLVSVSTVNNATSYTNRDVINTTSSFDSGSFTIESDGITVPESGIYSCSFTCYMTGSIQRGNVGVRFTINGTEQDEIAAMGYIRNFDGHNETSLTMTTLYNLSASDKVNIVFARLANSGTVNLQTNSSINIFKL